MNLKWNPIFLVLIMILCSGIRQGYSQSGTIEFESVVTEDEVYLYQLQDIRVDYGYNIYRQDPGQDFIQLNEEPVRGIDYPGELRSALGGDYETIRNNLEADDDTDLFFQLRGNSTTAKLYALIYPNAAVASGRLFMDQTAPMGYEVTYRYEILNQRDEPTGTVWEYEAVLEEKPILKPEITEVNNTGNRVNINWEFPATDDQDHVLRFSLLTQYPDEENYNVVPNAVILRDRSEDEYSFNFVVDRTDEEISFFVRATDAAGNHGPLSEDFTTEIEDNVPPARIQNVRTVIVEGNIQVQWPISGGLDVTGYNVYRSFEPDENYTLINDDLIPVTEPLFIDSDITRGNRYYYRVTAVDENDNESERSVVAERIVADYTPPPAPANLTAEYIPEDDRIDLEWEMDSIPDDFRTFVLLRRTVTESSAGRAFSGVSTEEIGNSSFSDYGNDGTGFTEGATYQFAILAADSSQNMSDTTFVTVHVPNLTPPEPPRSVTAVNRRGVRVNTSWDASSSTDVVQYNFYKKTGDGEFELTEELPQRTRLFRDEEITAGNELVYAVAAVDSSGNESEWSFTDPVFVRSSAPPRRVRNVRAIANNDGIHVRWEPVISEILDGYRVYYSNRSTGRYQPVAEQLIEETEYQGDPEGEEMVWFRVTAVDLSGNESRPSEPVQLIIR